jgi:hypothetical protein
MGFSGATEAAKGLETVSGISKGVPSGTVTEPLVQGGTGSVDIPMSGNSFVQTVESSKALQPGNVSNAINTEGATSSIKDAFLNKETIAGGVEGAFGGLGQIAAAKMEADGAEEALEREAEIAQQVKDDNQVGEFVAKVANITVPDWWNQYIDPSLTNKQQTPNNQPTTQAQTQSNPTRQGILYGGAIA